MHPILLIYLSGAALSALVLLAASLAHGRRLRSGWLDDHLLPVLIVAPLWPIIPLAAGVWLAAAGLVGAANAGRALLRRG